MLLVKLPLPLPPLEATSVYLDQTTIVPFAMMECTALQKPPLPSVRTVETPFTKSASVNVRLHLDLLSRTAC